MTMSIQELLSLLFRALLIVFLVRVTIPEYNSDEWEDYQNKFPAPGMETLQMNEKQMATLNGNSYGIHMAMTTSLREIRRGRMNSFKYDGSNFATVFKHLAQSLSDSLFHYFKLNIRNATMYCPHWNHKDDKPITDCGSRLDSPYKSKRMQPDFRMSIEEGPWPYVVGPGGCQQANRYIHLPLEFAEKILPPFKQKRKLTDASLVFGDPEKFMLALWIHYRYGVPPDHGIADSKQFPLVIAYRKAESGEAFNLMFNAGADENPYSDGEGYSAKTTTKFHHAKYCEILNPRENNDWTVVRKMHGCYIKNWQEKPKGKAFKIPKGSITTFTWKFSDETDGTYERVGGEKPLPKQPTIIGFKKGFHKTVQYRYTPLTLLCQGRNEMELIKEHSDFTIPRKKKNKLQKAGNISWTYYQMEGIYFGDTSIFVTSFHLYEAQKGKGLKLPVIIVRHEYREGTSVGREPMKEGNKNWVVAILFAGKWTNIPAYDNGQAPDNYAYDSYYSASLGPWLHLIAGGQSYRVQTGKPEGMLSILGGFGQFVDTMNFWKWIPALEVNIAYDKPNMVVPSALRRPGIMPATNHPHNLLVEKGGPTCEQITYGSTILLANTLTWVKYFPDERGRTFKYEDICWLVSPHWFHPKQHDDWWPAPAYAQKRRISPLELKYVNPQFADTSNFLLIHRRWYQHSYLIVQSAVLDKIVDSAYHRAYKFHGDTCANYKGNSNVYDEKKTHVALYIKWNTRAKTNQHMTLWYNNFPLHYNNFCKGKRGVKKPANDYVTKNGKSCWVVGHCREKDFNCLKRRGARYNCDQWGEDRHVYGYRHIALDEPKEGQRLFPTQRQYSGDVWGRQYGIHTSHNVGYGLGWCPKDFHSARMQDKQDTDGVTHFYWEKKRRDYRNGWCKVKTAIDVYKSREEQGASEVIMNFPEDIMKKSVPSGYKGNALLPPQDFSLQFILDPTDKDDTAQLQLQFYPPMPAFKPLFSKTDHQEVFLCCTSDEKIVITQNPTKQKECKCFMQRIPYIGMMEREDYISIPTEYEKPCSEMTCYLRQSMDGPNGGLVLSDRSNLVGVQVPLRCKKLPKADKWAMIPKDEKTKRPPFLEGDSIMFKCRLGHFIPSKECDKRAPVTCELNADKTKAQWTKKAACVRKGLCYREVFNANPKDCPAEANCERNCECVMSHGRDAMCDKRICVPRKGYEAEIIGTGLNPTVIVELGCLGKPPYMLNSDPSKMVLTLVDGNSDGIYKVGSKMLQYCKAKHSPMGIGSDPLCELTCESINHKRVWVRKNKPANYTDPVLCPACRRENGRRDCDPNNPNDIVCQEDFGAAGICENGTCTCMEGYNEHPNQCSSTMCPWPSCQEKGRYEKGSMSIFTVGTSISFHCDKRHHMDFDGLIESYTDIKCVLQPTEIYPHPSIPYDFLECNQTLLNETCPSGHISQCFIGVDNAICEDNTCVCPVGFKPDGNSICEDTFDGCARSQWNPREHRGTGNCTEEGCQEGVFSCNYGYYLSNGPIKKENPLMGTTANDSYETNCEKGEGGGVNAFYRFKPEVRKCDRVYVDGYCRNQNDCAHIPNTECRRNFCRCPPYGGAGTQCYEKGNAPDCKGVPVPSSPANTLSPNLGKKGQRYNCAKGHVVVSGSQAFSMSFCAGTKAKPYWTLPEACEPIGIGSGCKTKDDCPGGAAALCEEGVCVCTKGFYPSADRKQCTNVKCKANDQSAITCGGETHVKGTSLDKADAVCRNDGYWKLVGFSESPVVCEKIGFRTPCVTACKGKTASKGGNLCGNAGLACNSYLQLCDCKPGQARDRDGKCNILTCKAPVLGKVTQKGGGAIAMVQDPAGAITAVGTRISYECPEKEVFTHTPYNRDVTRCVPDSLKKIANWKPVIVSLFRDNKHELKCIPEPTALGAKCNINPKQEHKEVADAYCRSGVPYSECNYNVKAKKLRTCTCIPGYSYKDKSGNCQPIKCELDLVLDIWRKNRRYVISERGKFDVYTGLRWGVGTQVTKECPPGMFIGPWYEKQSNYTTKCRKYNGTHGKWESLEWILDNNETNNCELRDYRACSTDEDCHYSWGPGSYCGLGRCMCKSGYHEFEYYPGYCTQLECDQMPKGCDDGKIRISRKKLGFCFCPTDPDFHTQSIKRTVCEFTIDEEGRTGYKWNPPFETMNCSEFKFTEPDKDFADQCPHGLRCDAGYKRSVMYLCVEKWSTLSKKRPLDAWQQKKQQSDSNTSALPLEHLCIHTWSRRTRIAPVWRKNPHNAGIEARRREIKRENAIIVERNEKYKAEYKKNQTSTNLTSTNLTSRAMHNDENEPEEELLFELISQHAAFWLSHFAIGLATFFYGLALLTYLKKRRHYFQSRQQEGV